MRIPEILFVELQKCIFIDSFKIRDLCSHQSILFKLQKPNDAYLEKRKWISKIIAKITRVFDYYLTCMMGDSSDKEDEKYINWSRLLGNRVCYNEIPGIINDKLLEDQLRKQMEGNEVGKLLLEDGIKYETITEMRIEFCS